MGVLWTVRPLIDEIKSYLDETGIDYPNNPSRLPTGREINDVVVALLAFDVKINNNGVGSSWQAHIVSRRNQDEYALLNIEEYTGDDQEQELWFEKGSEKVIRLILQKLSNKAGPLVLIPDTGDEPTVISTAT